jgi:hypothetical protein
MFEDNDKLTRKLRREAEKRRKQKLERRRKTNEYPDWDKEDSFEYKDHYKEMERDTWITQE